MIERSCPYLRATGRISQVYNHPNLARDSSDSAKWQTDRHRSDIFNPRVFQSETDGTAEVAEATDTESEEVAQAEESTDGEEE